MLLKDGTLSMHIFEIKRLVLLYSSLEFARECWSSLLASSHSVLLVFCYVRRCFVIIYVFSCCRQVWMHVPGLQKKSKDNNSSVMSFHSNVPFSNENIIPTNQVLRAPLLFLFQICLYFFHLFLLLFFHFCSCSFLLFTSYIAFLPFLFSFLCRYLFLPFFRRNLNKNVNFKCIINYIL